MKQITQPKLCDTLRDPQPEVEVEPQIAAQARRAIERMLAIRE
jgi:quinolinate synthase